MGCVPIHRGWHLEGLEYDSEQSHHANDISEQTNYPIHQPDSAPIIPFSLTSTHLSFCLLKKPIASPNTV